MKFIDVERGWSAHLDLPTTVIPPCFGEVLADAQRHGTAVLLISVGLDNAGGGIGIAPHVDTVETVSYWHQNTPEKRAAAITFAAHRLRAGDVLLLEIQLNETGFPPAEACRAEFAAIHTAVAADIIVIEAAGDGSTNLDSYRAAGRRVLDPRHPDFKDSGAIMVGAADSKTLAPLSATNFGRRVDCFAWGSGVVTPTATAETSAASAIVAGAALSVQGVARQRKPRGYLKPRELRSLFRDRALNTSSLKGTSKHIGVMPNVKKIVESL
jgi:hypothetical protein